MHPRAIVVGDNPESPKIERIPVSKTVRALLLAKSLRHRYPSECAVSSWKKSDTRWKSVGVAQFDALEESVVLPLSVVVVDASFDGLMLIALGCTTALELT